MVILLQFMEVSKFITELLNHTILFTVDAKVDNNYHQQAHYE